MKFVHAADLHLDSPLRGLDRYEGAPVEQFRNATRVALRNLVDLCLSERADFLLIAGDLYDGNWREYRTGLLFAAEMARLADASIPVVLVRGNHDAESHITRTLRLPPNVRELSSSRPESDDRTLAHLGVAVHGQSFAQRDVRDDLAARYPDRLEGRFNIGLLHTCLSGREGHDAYAPCSVETLRGKGYDYWALGHVHQRELLHDDPPILFPGNLQGRHARETGAKGATLVTVENGRVIDLEARALDAVRWTRCEVDAGGAQDRDEVLDRTRARLLEAARGAEGRPLAARVILSGTTRAHGDLASDGERLANEVRALALELPEPVWVEKVRAGTRAAIDLAALAARDDAAGHLARALTELRGDEAALVALLDDLGELRKRLPTELREGDDAIRLERPADLAPILDDVEQILLPLLLRREPTP